MSTPVEIAVKATGTSTTAAALDKIEGRASSLGKTLKRVVVGGALLAGAALVKVGADSVQAASKSQQSLGATQTVFRKYAKTVVRESKRAADSVGLSANEYRELANVVGASLIGAGVPIRKATDLTAKLEKRAADLAATFGGSTKEAIESVSSLLRGEADPIERYGISIKQSDVNARLASKGLDDLTGSGLKQAEMQARLDLLFQKSSKSAGAFARESGTLEGAQQRLSAKVENLEAKFGKLLLPVLTSGVNLISRKVIPAAEDLADWLARNQDEIGGLAGSVKSGLLPPLQALGGIAADVAGFVGSLPPEVQQLAAQAAIAAVVIPKLNSAIAGMQLTGFIGDLRNAETRTAALGTAARTAAGIGGVLALGRSVQETNPKLKALETVAGAAAAGFSVGGPWGAVAGTLIGVGVATSNLVGDTNEMRTGLDKAGESAAGVTLKVKDYASTLDQASGAVQKLTRQEVIRAARADGILPILTQLDVSQRDLVGATLGQEGATRRLNRAFDDNFGKLTALQQVKLSEWLRTNTRGFALQQNEVRENARATETWKAALKGLPPKVQTAVKALGAEASAAELRKLKRQYDLSPKRVQTIIDAVGADVTIRKVRGVWKVFEQGRAVRPNLAGWQNDLANALAGGKRTADRGVSGLNSIMSGGTRKARPDLGPFTTALTQALSRAESTARTGGTRIGSGAKTGLTDGFAGAITTFSNAVVAAVNAAIAAGKRAADSHSPSRKTAALGRDLARGLEKGMNDERGKTGKAGARLVDQVLKASASSAADLNASIRKILEGHKLKGAELKRALKSLDDETKALNRNAAAQDRVNAKLSKARDTLKQLVGQSRDYSKSIRDAVVESGNITGLGKDEAGTATTGGILDQLRTRLQAAQRFADLIGKLTKAHLNQTTLQQLLSAGVEGGLSTAEAIISGGSAAVGEINTLTAQLTAAGSALGASTANTMFGAGIQAAEGLVKGLESKAKDLDRIADRMAERLVKAIKRALKIESPSTVFRDLGKMTVKGLELGLDDTHVHRAGTRLATSLVDGFADPKLTARAVLDATLAGGGGGTPLNFTLSAEQMDDLEHGRRISVKLDAFRAAGGRTRS